MMNNEKMIRLSSAVDLCMKKAKFYQPEMFGSDQECFTAKLVATELAGEIRNLPPVDAETHIKKLEAELEIREIQKNAMFAKAEQLERERDFLLKYLTDSHWAACDICKHEPEEGNIHACKRIREVKGAPCFEWRGLCKENGGVEE